VFYFKIREAGINSARWTETGDALIEKAEYELRGRFRLDGVVLDDQDVLKAIAGDDPDGVCYNARGYSSIIPVRAAQSKDGGESVLVKSGAASRRLLDDDEFERLRKDVRKKVSDFCGDLTDGVITALPRQIKTLNACEWCGYRGICGYDAVFG
jgi:ATP-dependent helicase/nuclease subunit B